MVRSEISDLDTIQNSKVGNATGRNTHKEVKSFLRKTIERVTSASISHDTHPTLNNQEMSTTMSPSLDHWIFAIKEELTNVRTLDLIARTTSILEKIFWSIIAICGTIFIYHVVTLQLENWRDNPMLATSITKQLADMPLPAVTFCHKGLQKYGPIEKLGNYINPNKSIPKEVVAIRNEFLKVQFQKLNGRIDHSENFCEWLDSISWTDEGKENVIFSHIQTEQRQQLIDDCLNFGKLIQNYSSQNQLSINQIKSNIFKIIETDNWWNLDKFFKWFISALRRNTTKAEEKLFQGKHFIVIGGNNDNLDPAVIHLNKDGTVNYELCLKRNLDARLDAVGEFFDDKFVVCGGYPPKIKMYNCDVIDESDNQTFNMTSDSGRQLGSYVKLNQSTIWITGGRDTNYDILNSTEYVTINGSKAGNDMPIKVASHCMVMFKPNVILLIGGNQVRDPYVFSNKTWVIDLTKDFKMTGGPPLIHVRKGHSCGKMTDEYGNVLVIVAGGSGTDSVEILNTTLMEKWIEGPTLPYQIASSSMVSTKDNKVILVGGGSGEFGSVSGLKVLNVILELDSINSKWKEIKLPLKKLRTGHFAFEISNHNRLKLFCDKEALDELQYLFMMSSALTNSEIITPNILGPYLHYSIVDAQEYGFEQNIQIISENLRALTSLDDIDLFSVTSIFGINDFRNLELLEEYEIDNDYFNLNDFKKCYERLTMDLSTPGFNHVLQDLHEPKEDLYLKSSPCHKIANYTDQTPECKGYCLWHHKIMTNLAKKDINTLLKYVLPEAKTLIKPKKNNLATKLFDTSVPNQNESYKLAHNPLIWICKDNMYEKSMGNDVKGLSFKICNKTSYVQTDVGVCLANEPMMPLEGAKIVKKTIDSTISDDLRNVEHLMVISVSKLGKLHEFKTIVPRTIHRNFDIQMQIQESKGFPEILFGSNQEKNKKSITLKPGHEYKIELDPYGQYSTDDFKAMSMDKRQCRLNHEVFDGSTHPIYTQANCKYDCQITQAYETCRCIPWDFVNNLQDANECDIFGRTCFFNMIETLTHGSNENCTHCIDECDFVRYRRRITEQSSIRLKEKEIIFYGDKLILNCNEYICIMPTASPLVFYSCFGSKTFCEFIKDLNNTLFPDLIKETLWPNVYGDYGFAEKTSFLRMAKTFFNNTIIVRLRYKKSDIDFTKLDVRTTTTDKIANFGGTFGIWAELTGFSLLGLINLVIILFKLLFRPRN